MVLYPSYHTARALKMATTSTAHSYLSIAPLVFPMLSNSAACASQRPLTSSISMPTTGWTAMQMMCFPGHLSMFKTPNLWLCFLSSNSNLILLLLLPFQPRWLQVQSGLLCLDTAPVCCTTDGVQQARPRARSHPMAVGHLTQTGMLLSIQDSVDCTMVLCLGVVEHSICCILMLVEYVKESISSTIPLHLPG